MARKDFYDDKQDNPVGEHTTHMRCPGGLAQWGLVSSKTFWWFDPRSTRLVIWMWNGTSGGKGN